MLIYTYVCFYFFLFYFLTFCWGHFFVNAQNGVMVVACGDGFGLKASSIVIGESNAVICPLVRAVVAEYGQFQFVSLDINCQVRIYPLYL